MVGNKLPEKRCKSGLSRHAQSHRKYLAVNKCFYWLAEGISLLEYSTGCNVREK